MSRSIFLYSHITFYITVHLCHVISMPLAHECASEMMETCMWDCGYRSLVGWGPPKYTKWHEVIFHKLVFWVIGRLYSYTPHATKKILLIKSGSVIGQLLEHAPATGSANQVQTYHRSRVYQSRLGQSRFPSSLSFIVLLKFVLPFQFLCVSSFMWEHPVRNCKPFHHLWYN